MLDIKAEVLAMAIDRTEKPIHDLCAKERILINDSARRCGKKIHCDANPGSAIVLILCTGWRPGSLAKILQVIGDATREAKERHAIGADALTDWAEFAAPALLGRAARLYSRMHLANMHRPVFNVTISNVPGPPFPLYSIGSRMVANYPVGPIMDGGGLNMTVMSYLDQLDFGPGPSGAFVGDCWEWTASGGSPARARTAKRRWCEKSPSNLATLDLLVKNGAKIILMAHLGRPKGQKEPSMSLRPVAAKLSASSSPLTR